MLIFPNVYIPNFTEDNTAFLIPSPSNRLCSQYSTEACFSQYILKDSFGSDTTVYFRFSKNYLKTSDKSIQAFARYLVLDVDFDEKTTWDQGWRLDPDKTAIFEWCKSDKYLQKVSYIYKTISGIRLIFRVEDFPLETDADFVKWEHLYKKLISELPLPFHNARFDPCGANVCQLFYLPRIVRVKNSITHDLRTREVWHRKDIFGDTVIEYALSRQVLDTLASGYESVVESISKANIDYPELDVEFIKESLWQDSLISHLRDEKPSLDYHTWRAVGVNIATLLPNDDGLAIFHEISSWDVKYNPAAVDKHWSGMMASAENYGPTTFRHFDWSVLGRDFPFDPSSSIAGQVYKGAIRSGIVSPLEEKVLESEGETKSENAVAKPNHKEVEALLAAKMKVKGDEVIREVLKDFRNLVIILRNDNKYKSKIRRNHLGPVDLLGNAPIEDEVITSIRLYICATYGLNFTSNDIYEAVTLIASENEFHPVYDWLQSLTWDGKDRMAEVQSALGVDKDAFSVTLLRRFFISLVVRPLTWFDPYATNKVDTVLVLKGKQGAYKSTFFSSLCANNAWFSDSLPSIEKNLKDASIHMLGSWIIELGEFEGMVNKSSIQNLKAFVTRTHEKYRPPYGRKERRRKRTSVMVGSTNSDTFLNDPTGDRRWWVIEVPKRIDKEWIVRNREQIFAQAKHLFDAGEQWWLTDTEDEENAKRNMRFRRPEPYLYAIEDFLDTNPVLHGKEGFTKQQLCAIALDKTIADMTSSQLQKVNHILATLNWEKKRERINGKRAFVYRRKP